MVKLRIYVKNWKNWFVIVLIELQEYKMYISSLKLHLHMDTTPHWHNHSKRCTSTYPPYIDQEYSEGLQGLDHRLVSHYNLQS